MPKEIKEKIDGFSLIEVMIVSAMLGGLALFGMQMMKNQQDATLFNEAKNEEISLIRNIQMALTKKNVCQKTFANKKVGDQIDAILLGDETPLFSLESPINGLLKITSMRTVEKTVPKGGGFGVFDLQLSIDRLKKSTGARSVQKSINIQAEFDELGQIINCFSDVDSAIQTSKIEMCESLGGTFNSDTSKCTLNSSFNNSATEVVSKALLDQIVTQMRLEFDQKITAMKNAGESGTVDLGAYQLNSLKSCDGPSVRFRFKEKSSSNCQKELQFRICDNGKWGEWSGSYTYTECN